MPYTQSKQWYSPLSRPGVTVEMVSYPRSEHVVWEPGVVMDAFQRNLDWFAKYVPSY